MKSFSFATIAFLSRLTVVLALATVVPFATGCARHSGPTYTHRAVESYPGKPRPGAQELRGVWITNVDSDVLLSKQDIADMMDFLAESGFNVVYPVVWNKAYTMYPSDVMERYFDRRIDPVYGDRDPLQELIVEAHRVGIEVIPWFEFGFASSYNEGGGPLLEQRPQWKALDAEGNLAKKNNFEWMNAFDPEVQRFMTELVLEVARKYDVDGIQGDDRLPAQPSLAGYDPLTASLWREATGTEPPEDEMDREWVQFRADLLTEYLEELRDRVKAIDPNLIVSSSPTPSLGDWGLLEYLQDSTRWINERSADTIHPQLYRRELDRYQEMVDDLVEKHTREQLEIVTPGVLMRAGPWVIDPEYMLGAVDYNREKGFAGEVWFFYEGLTANDGELAHLLAEGPYAEPATLPYRHGHVWRPGGIVAPVENAATEGAWEKTPNLDGFMQVTGSPGGASLRYRFDVPAAGTYDVYVYHRGGPRHTTLARYRTPPLDRPGGSVRVDQSDRANRGWLRVGRVTVDAGDGQELLLLDASEALSDRVTFAGPAMLLINRRHSPDSAFE